MSSKIAILADVSSGKLLDSRKCEKCARVVQFHCAWLNGIVGLESIKPWILPDVSGAGLTPVGYLVYSHVIELMFSEPAA